MTGLMFDRSKEFEEVNEEYNRNSRFYIWFLLLLQLTIRMSPGLSSGASCDITNLEEEEIFKMVCDFD